jgi:hypothetical protein
MSRRHHTPQLSISQTIDFLSHQFPGSKIYARTDGVVVERSPSVGAMVRIHRHGVTVAPCVPDWRQALWIALGFVFLFGLVKWVTSTKPRQAALCESLRDSFDRHF